MWRGCARADSQGEESGGGKIHIVNAGYYKDVDVSIMSHPAPLDGGFYPFLALYMFEVEFFGKNAHAVSLPSRVIDG